VKEKCSKIKFFIGKELVIKGSKKVKNKDKEELEKVRWAVKKKSEKDARKDSKSSVE